MDKIEDSSIIERRLQQKFTINDNRILQCDRLSLEARGLYCYILSLPPDWEFSEKRIANNAGCGIDKIKRILKELFDIGLVSRRFINDRHGYRKSVYTLFDFDTICEKPTLEKPTLEKPINNKEININKEINKQNIEFDKKDSKEPFLSHSHVQNEILHDCENQARETKQVGEQPTLFANTQQVQSPKPKSNGYTEEFETFWILYRKHNAKHKAKAFEAYGKALKKGVTHTQLLEALKKQTEIWDIEKRLSNYTPHCSTWLNSETYNDDFEAIKKQSLTRNTASAPKDYNSYEGGIESFKNLRDNDREADIDSIPKDIIKDMLRFIVHWSEIVKNGGYTNAEVEQLDRDGVKYIKDTYWSEVSLEYHLLSYGYGTNIYQLLKNKGYF